MSVTGATTQVVAAIICVSLLGCICTDRLPQRDQARTDLHVVATAAKLYKEKTGNWPTSVAELAPPKCAQPLCYLVQIPRDPWSSEIVLLPSPEGPVIVSPGPDRRMENGGGDDISIRVAQVETPLGTTLR